MPKSTSTALLILISIACLCRFLFLERTPEGFYIDEAFGASNSLCIAQNFHSEKGALAPLFFPELESFHTAPFVYFSAAWSKLFGNSIQSLRSVSAFFSCLAILGIYFLLRLLLTKFSEGLSEEKIKFASLAAATAAAVSPWSFQFARIFWDPAVTPALQVLGLYFLFVKQDLKHLSFSAMFFALAMYSYPPARVATPLMILLSLVFLQLSHQGLSKKHFFYFFLFGTLLCLPLIYFSLNGYLLGRFRAVSILFQAPAGTSFLEKGIFIIQTTLQNIIGQFKFTFLFRTGDPNLRHSTNLFGMLSWLDLSVYATIALVVSKKLFLYLADLIFSKPDSESVSIFGFVLNTKNGSEPTVGFKNLKIAAFLFLCLIACIFPAALTYDGYSHALRSITAYAFFSMLTGFMFLLIGNKYRTLFAAISIVFFGFFLSKYFIDYHKVAGAHFDSYITFSANQYQAEHKDWKQFVIENSSYPNAALKYYLMSKGNYSCVESGQVAP